MWEKKKNRLAQSSGGHAMSTQSTCNLRSKQKIGSASFFFFFLLADLDKMCLDATFRRWQLKNAEQLICRPLHVARTRLLAATHTHPSECRRMCVACALMGIISVLVVTKYFAALLPDSSLRRSPPVPPPLLLKQKPNDLKSNCLVFHLCLINTQTPPSNHFKKRESCLIKLAVFFFSFVLHFKGFTSKQFCYATCKNVITSG